MIGIWGPGIWSFQTDNGVAFSKSYNQLTTPAYRPSPVFQREYPECPGCGRDLTRLDSAIFCPGCGRQLQFRITPRERVLHLATDLVRILSFGRLFSLPEQTHVMSTDRAPILIGYGKAMFRLGQRYESSGLKNRKEAMRCYRKSARLGNGDAKARLGSR